MFFYKCEQKHQAIEKLNTTIKVGLLSSIVLLHSATALSNTTQKKLPLSTAIDRSLNANPSLKVFRFQQDALEGQAMSAELRPGFQLGIVAENFSGSDEYMNFDSAELTVSLSSVLELGGKRDARMDASRYRMDQFTMQREIEALALLGDTTRRFIDTLKAQELVKLANENVTLAEETLINVRRRVDAGAATSADLYRAQSALAQSKLTVAAEKQQRAYYRIALSSQWGKTTPDFSEVAGSLYRFNAVIDYQTLYDRLLNNPNVQFYAATERVKAAESRLTQTQSAADFSWSVGVRQFRRTENTALVASFNMPLFSVDRNKGALRSANAAQGEASLRKEQAILNMNQQLFRAFTNRQQALLTVNSLRTDIIPALQKSLDSIKDAYLQGRYSYLEYITARQELLTAKRAKIEAAAAVLLYATEIEQLTSDSLSARSNV